jgi:Na+/glutamate symporter
VYDVPRLFAAIVPLGYEGGHGVVAGNRAALERYGYPQGVSLGYVAATVGLLVGTLLGCALANWARWQGLLAAHQMQDENRQHDDAIAEDNSVMGAAEESMQQEEQLLGQDGPAIVSPSDPSNHRTNTQHPADIDAWRGVDETVLTASPAKAGGDSSQGSSKSVLTPSYADFDGCYPDGSSERPRLGTCVVAVSSMDSFAHHLSIVGCTLGCAWCAKLGVSALSELRSGGGPPIAALRSVARFFDPLPLFLYALLCAVCVQAVMDRSKRCKALLPLDRDTAASICATAQDFLIVSAVCTNVFHHLPRL